MVDFTSNTLDIFIVGAVDQERAKKFRKKYYTKSKEKVMYPYI